MAQNTEYTKIKESTLSAFFSKLKSAFWNKADVTYLSLADIAATGQLADATQDSTHRTVSDAEKSLWNSKQNKQAFVTIDSTQQTTGATLALGTDYVVSGTIDTYVFTLPDSPDDGIISVIFLTGLTPAITFNTAATVYTQTGFSIEEDTMYEMNIRACNGNYYIVLVAMEEQL